jgi:sugar-specific transcriptional regulator TrmB
MQTAQEEITLFNSEADSKFYEYRIELEKIRDELVEFGLSKNQANVFMYLGKYGPSTSRQVCKALKLPRTETYSILNSLLNRGIIVSEFQHPTRYSALPMNKAISTMIQAAQEKVNNLAKKEIKLTQIWNKIPATIENNMEISEKFQMLEGTNRINNKIREMIKDTRNSFKILCTEKDLFKFYYSDFIEILSNMPIDVKLVVSPTQKLPQFIRTLDENKVRILPINKIDSQCFIIKDDEEVLIFLRNSFQHSKNIFSFWTDTTSLVKSMGSLFEYSWQSSLPLNFEKYIDYQYN